MTRLEAAAVLSHAELYLRMQSRMATPLKLRIEYADARMFLVLFPCKMLFDCESVVELRAVSSVINSALLGAA